MQLILDVMEAYKGHLGLPLTLINVDDDITNEQQKINPFLSQQIKQQLIYQVEAIQHPTVLSVTDFCTQQDLLYMVTPVFHVQQKHYFIIAGPYILSEHMLVHTYIEDIMLIPSKQVEHIMERFKNLYFIITAKGHIESNFLLSKEVVNVLQFIDRLKIEHIEQENLLAVFIQQMYTLKVIDFAGYAKYVKEGLYEIHQVVGLNVGHLTGKQFYLGEGILGKAMFKKESFFWEKNLEVPYIEFFSRYDVLPEQLFGIPVMTGEYANTIVFGGSFQRNKLHEADLLMLTKMFE